MRNFGNRRYRVPLPDPVYGSRLVAILINKVMKHGKKTLAQKIVYKALRKAVHQIELDEARHKKKGQRSPFDQQIKRKKHPSFLVERCVKILSPCLLTRIHRFKGGRGRKGHLYPMTVYKKACFSLTWILAGAKGRSNKKAGQTRNLSEHLAVEIVSVLRGKGHSLKLKGEFDEVASEFIHFYYPKHALKTSPDSPSKQLEWYLRTSKYKAVTKRLLR